MTRGQITLMRWALVAVYVVLGWSFALGGMTGTEFGCLLVVGAIFLVVIVLADWVNEAPRREE